MPLTGQAKTDYQCEYMRRRRSNFPSTCARLHSIRTCAAYTVSYVKIGNQFLAQ